MRSASKQVISQNLLDPHLLQPNKSKLKSDKSAKSTRSRRSKVSRGSRRSKSKLEKIISVELDSGIKDDKKEQEE